MSDTLKRYEAPITHMIGAIMVALHSLYLSGLSILLAEKRRMQNQTDIIQDQEKDLDDDGRLKTSSTPNKYEMYMAWATLVIGVLFLVLLCLLGLSLPVIIIAGLSILLIGEHPIRFWMDKARINI